MNPKLKALIERVKGLVSEIEKETGGSSDAQPAPESKADSKEAPESDKKDKKGDKKEGKDSDKDGVPDKKDAAPKNDSKPFPNAAEGSDEKTDAKGAPPVEDSEKSSESSEEKPDNSGQEAPPDQAAPAQDAQPAPQADDQAPPADAEAPPAEDEALPQDGQPDSEEGGMEAPPAEGEQSPEQDAQAEDGQADPAAPPQDDAQNPDEASQEPPADDQQQDPAQGGRLYLAGDGDSIGAKVGQAVLSDDVESLHQVSQHINAGQNMVIDWCEQNGGRVISAGGDEFVLELPAIQPEQIEQLRQQYEQMVGATLTIGTGASMSEAGKALIMGKLNGKNQTIAYSPEMEDQLMQAHQGAAEAGGEAQKQDDHYLGSLYADDEQQDDGYFHDGQPDQQEQPDGQPDQQEQPDGQDEAAQALEAVAPTEQQDPSAPAPGAPMEDPNQVMDAVDSAALQEGGEQQEPQLEQADEADLSAVYNQDMAQASGDNIKNKLGEILQAYRQDQSFIEESAQSNPQLYRECMVLLQQMIKVARMIAPSAPGDQPEQQAPAMQPEQEAPPADEASLDPAPSEQEAPPADDQGASDEEEPQDEDMEKARVDEGKPDHVKAISRADRNDRTGHSVRTASGKRFSSTKNAIQRRRDVEDGAPGRRGEKITGEPRGQRHENEAGVHLHQARFAPKEQGKAGEGATGALSEKGGGKSWRTGGSRSKIGAQIAHDDVKQAQSKIKPNLPK
jgi:hypothetical protein